MATQLRDRPERTYTTGAVTRSLRFIAPAGALALSIYVAFTYDELPETVPTHFSFSGEADDWGPKSTAWVLLGINIVIVAGMAWLSSRPRWFNYPASITNRNAQFMYREGERMLVWVSVAVTVVFYGAILSIYEIENPLLVLGLIAMLAITITGLIRTSLASGKKAEPAQMPDSTIDVIDER